MGIFSHNESRGNQCLGLETKRRLGTALGLTGAPAALAASGPIRERERRGGRPGRTHKHSQEEGCGNSSSAETGSPARLSSASGGI